ncbi:MAG: hypothetical protein HY539_06255 [Deltaproteobacteria bacterium]|nr:hypothetical protein [Deltaproteobacteria bacterium]
MPEISASNLVTALLQELHLPTPDSLTNEGGKVICVAPLKLADGRLEAVRVTAEVKPGVAARLMMEHLPQLPSDRRYLYPEMHVARTVYHQTAGTMIAKKELRHFASCVAFSRSPLELPVGEIDDLVERMVRGVLYAADHLGQDDPRLQWTSSVFTSLRGRPGSAAVLASFVGVLFTSGLLIGVHSK